MVLGKGLAVCLAIAWRFCSIFSMVMWYPFLFGIIFGVTVEEYARLLGKSVRNLTDLLRLISRGGRQELRIAHVLGVKKRLLQSAEDTFGLFETHTHPRHGHTL